MALVNDRRNPRGVDAILRADGDAQSAAGAAFAHIIARRFPHRFPDGDAVPGDVRRVTDVEKLAVCFV